MPVRTLLIAWLALAGCVVTRAPRIDERPRWRVLGDPNDEAVGQLDYYCLRGRAFVRKSGKQGFGVAMQLRSRADCTVAFDRVQLVFDDGAVDIATIPAIPMTGRSQLYAWLPVAFDNNAAWNAGRTSATLVLELTIAEAPAVWRIPVEQR
jgi:hypothetical protein